jgi:hypothetical protein
MALLPAAIDTFRLRPPSGMMRDMLHHRLTSVNMPAFGPELTNYNQMTIFRF